MLNKLNFGFVVVATTLVSLDMATAQAPPVPGPTVPGALPGQAVPGGTGPGQGGALVPGQPGAFRSGQTSPVQNIPAQAGGQPIPATTVIGSGFGNNFGAGMYGLGYSGFYGQGTPYSQPKSFSSSNPFFTSPNNSTYFGFGAPYNQATTSGAFTRVN